MNGYLRDHSSPRASVIALGVCAAGAAIHALWYLRVVSTGRRGWLGGRRGAAVSCAFALIAGVAFLVVAFIEAALAGAT